MTENSKLLVWRRYVDDTFTIVKADVDEAKCRQLLNTLDRCIKFTVAPEVDNTIAFLDVLVKRHDKGFDTTVYRKETATKLMLKWNSLIPTAYTRACIYPLVNRANRICSRPDLLHDELLYIRKMAAFNGYPSNFVQNIINKQLNQFYQPKPDLVQPTPTQNKKYKYVQIPYIGAPSYIYGKRLKSIIQQYNPTSDLRVIYKTTNETRRYFPTKDKLKTNQKSEVVYQISCLECNKTYIGKTIRQSYRRLNEHEKDAAKAIIFVTQAYSIVRQRKKYNNISITRMVIFKRNPLLNHYAEVPDYSTNKQHINHNKIKSIFHFLNLNLLWENMHLLLVTPSTFPT
jgi:hypothetical protein